MCFGLLAASPAAAQTAKLSTRIFGIDAAFMKNSTSGQIVLLTVRDPAGKNLTLAMALVPVEDAENYSWFFLNCMKNPDIAKILNDRRTVIFSDRDKGLAAAMQFQLPLAHQA
jgi:hypothetical protein